MARIKNGSLHVIQYFPTINTGEYTFVDAIFDNQADATGNGSLDIQVGYLVIVPSIDPNTLAPLPGVAHRYKITSIVSGSNVDGIHISATILWDECTPFCDPFLDNSYASLSEPSINLKLSLPVSEEVYPDLYGGIDEASYNNDLRCKIDSLIGLTGIQGGTGIQGNTGVQIGRAHV